MNDLSMRKVLRRKLFVCALILALIILVMMLQGCKPTAFPSTLNSPLLTPGAPTLTEVAIRQMLGTKEAAFAQMGQTDAANLLTPKPPGYLMPTLTRLPTTPIPTAFAPIVGSHAIPAGAGTIRDIPSPGYGAPYRFDNQWVEYTHNARIGIFVTAGVKNGTDGLPSTQGIVIVEVWQRSVISNSVIDNRTSIDYYLTPIQAGFVKIVDALGERLVLQSENGTAFYFDVPSHQFVPSLSWTPSPVPISPLATPTLPPTTASP